MSTLKAFTNVTNITPPVEVTLFYGTNKFSSVVYNYWEELF